MKRGRVRCPIKRGGQTNGRTSHRGRKLSDLRINGIFGALGILRGWCFEDGQTQVVQNRDFGPVACEVVETEEVLDLHTEHLHLHFEKGPFAPDRLYIELKGQYAVYGSRWHYGDQPETLKGTSRTLDEVDGAMELHDGILSKAGYALLDDSASYLYDDESGFRARSYPEVDLYFFGYGRDYLGALKIFTI